MPTINIIESGLASCGEGVVAGHFEPVAVEG
jgi:hypothetical protein